MKTTSAIGPFWGALRPASTAAVCISLVRHRVVRGPMRKLAKWFLAWLGPVFDVEVNGLKLRCRVNDNLAEERAIFNRLEQIGRITGGLMPGHTFVDIGANSGIFTMHAAKAVGPDGCVLAVEPSPLLLERLHFNVAANGFRNVRIAPVAVGDASGSATLNIVSRQRGRSSLHPVHGADGQVAVPVEPLFALLAAHAIERIDAMKIDIEGYEDRALLPFFETAPRTLWPRHILVEIDHQGIWKQDCIEAMVALGYRIVWRGRKDALMSI